jgi:hypothetical protein
MDSTPINVGMTQNTPIRMPERLELKDTGDVQVQAASADKVEDKVDIKKGRVKEKDGIIANTTKTVLAGFGLGSGLVGGAAAGAGIGGGGGALSGLLGNSLSWASVTTGAKVGGVVGAVLFGVAGTYGGWTFASGLIKSGKFVKKLLFTKEPLSQEAQQALNTLKTVEDNPKDANRVLKYINGNLGSDENLQKEAELYTGLVGQFTNKNTDAALSAYATFKKHLPPGEERDKALGELGKFNQTFKTPEESMDALYTVLENLNAKDNVSQECDNFRSIVDSLKKCSPEHAEISPAVAGEAYSVLKKSFSPEERPAAIAATLGQFVDKKAEPKESMENLKTIVQNRQKDDDLANETKNLLGLAAQTDGNMETARLAYTTTKANFAPGTRGEALKSFFALNDVEKTPKEAAAALLAINKGLYEGEKLPEQVQFYTDMHKLVDSSAKPSDSALAAYKTITTGFKKGKDRDEAVEQFTKLVSAEGAAKQDVGNAAADLEFVSSHMSSGEKLGDQVDKFIGLLASQGSSSKAQQAYVDAKFVEMYGK